MTACIDEHRGRFGVEPICRTLHVSASAYRRATDQRSARVIGDERLVERIRELHATNYFAYGDRKIWLALKRAGDDVGRDRVKRPMRTNAIVGAKRCGKPWRATTADPTAARNPDLVQRDFSADRPDALWVADSTYLRCWKDWCSFARNRGVGVPAGVGKHLRAIDRDHPDAGSRNVPAHMDVCPIVTSALVDLTGVLAGSSYGGSRYLAGCSLRNVLKGLRAMFAARRVAGLFAVVGLVVVAPASGGVRDTAPDGADALAPDASVVAAVVDARQRQEDREEWLRGAQARDERLRSRTAFRGRFGTRAIELARDGVDPFRWTRWGWSTQPSP